MGCTGLRESYIRFIQYILGLVIVVTLLIHLAIFSSYTGEGYVSGLSWESVAERMNNPYYDLLYGILLFALLTHGFIGLRNILYEYIASGRLRLIISWTLLIIYILLMAYGLAPIIASA